MALNEQVKLPDENDAIGIIICKSKKKTVVEYALKTFAGRGWVGDLYCQSIAV